LSSECQEGYAVSFIIIERNMRWLYGSIICGVVSMSAITYAVDFGDIADHLYEDDIAYIASE
jgi:hypothetical protein